MVLAQLLFVLSRKPESDARPAHKHKTCATGSNLVAQGWRKPAQGWRKPAPASAEARGRTVYTLVSFIFYNGSRDGSSLDSYSNFSKDSSHFLADSTDSRV